MVLVETSSTKCAADAPKLVHSMLSASAPAGRVGATPWPSLPLLPPLLGMRQPAAFCVSSTAGHVTAGVSLVNQRVQEAHLAPGLSEAMRGSFQRVMLHM